MYAFISHASADRDQVDRLLELLHRDGIETWVAQDDIPPGQNYMELIPDVIRDCGCFVLLLTREAEGSKDVKRELRIACNHFPERVVPISLGYDPVGNTMKEYLLGTVQYKKVRAIDGDDGEMRKILRQIRALMQRAEPPREPRSFTLENISVAGSGRYLYLGWGEGQLSCDGTGYFLYDRYKETLDLVRLTGRPERRVIASIKCRPEDVQGGTISISSDGRYFLLKRKNRLSLADIYADPPRWIVMNHPLPVKRGEDVFYISWPRQDQFVLYCGKGDGKSFRVQTQVEMSIKPYSLLKRTEIKAEQPFGELIGSRRLDQTVWQFFHTTDDGLIAWNPRDKTCAPGAEILRGSQEKRPALPDGVDQLSLDNSMYYVFRSVGQVFFLDIIDPIHQQLLCHMPAWDVGGFALLNGYKAMTYDRFSGVASIRDFQRQEETILATADFFYNSDAFYHELPFSAVIDQPTGTMLYLAINPDERHFRVVAVDANGAIVAVSEEAEHHYDSDYSVDLQTVPDGGLAEIKVEPGSPQYRINGVNTQLYYFKYHREGGRLVFDPRPRAQAATIHPGP